MAILAALVGFFYLIRGFTNRQLVERVAALLDSPYTNRQATYDLRRLKRKGLIEKIAGTQRFQLTRLGRRVAMLFTKTYGRVLAPGLSVLDPRLQMTYRRVALSAQLDAALRKRSTILWKRNWSRVKLDRFVNFSGYQVYLVRRNQIPHLYSDSEGELADGGERCPRPLAKSLSSNGSSRWKCASTARIVVSHPLTVVGVNLRGIRMAESVGDTATPSLVGRPTSEAVRFLVQRRNSQRPGSCLFLII